VPFGNDEIPVLAPEHVLTAKLVFDRAKDWIDIEQMLVMQPALDTDEVHRWLEGFLPPDDPRLDRLRRLERDLLG
jgi:hypothetical protein